MGLLVLALVAMAMGVRPAKRAPTVLPPRKREREVGAKRDACPARRSSKRIREGGPRESFAAPPRYNDRGASRRKAKGGKTRQSRQGVRRKARMQQLGRAGGLASADGSIKEAIAAAKAATKKRQRDEDEERAVEAARRDETRRLSLRVGTLAQGEVVQLFCLFTSLTFAQNRQVNGRERVQYTRRVKTCTVSAGKSCQQSRKKSAKCVSTKKCC
jgi:hypothetical protein